MADALMTVVGREERRVVGQEWVPRPELLAPLVEMGISENSARRGLYFTGNSSVDDAASWVMDNLNNPDINAPLKVILDGQNQEEDSESSQTKMVFVVNSELKMGVGKVAAQVAHAGLNLLKVLLKDEHKYQKMILEWEDTGSTKIVLRGMNASQLMDMEVQAKEAGIPCDLVVDAGKTQVAAASVTTLCLFGNSINLNKITGQLPLL